MIWLILLKENSLFLLKTNKSKEEKKNIWTIIFVIYCQTLSRDPIDTRNDKKTNIYFSVSSVSIIELSE